MKQMQWLILIVIILGVNTAAAIVAGAAGGYVETRLERADGPQLAVTVTATAEPLPELAALTLTVQIFPAADADAAAVWRGDLTVPLTDNAPWQAKLPLQDKLPDAAARYRIELGMRNAQLNIEYREVMHVERHDARIPSYGYRKNGIFPANRVEFAFALAGFPTDTQRELPVILRLTDNSNNLLLDTLAPVQPARNRSWHTLDTTPRGPEEPVGPFRCDVTIESDVHGINFRTSHSFA